MGLLFLNICFDVPSLLTGKTNWWIALKLCFIYLFFDFLCLFLAWMIWNKREKKSTELENRNSVILLQPVSRRVWFSITIGDSSVHFAAEVLHGNEMVLAKLSVMASPTCSVLSFSPTFYRDLWFFLSVLRSCLLKKAEQTKESADPLSKSICWTALWARCWDVSSCTEWNFMKLISETMSLQF